MALFNRAIIVLFAISFEPKNLGLVPQTRQTPTSIKKTRPEYYEKLLLPFPNITGFLLLVLVKFLEAFYSNVLLNRFLSGDFVEMY